MYLRPQPSYKLNLACTTREPVSTAITYKKNKCIQKHIPRKVTDQRHSFPEITWTLANTLSTSLKINTVRTSGSLSSRKRTMFLYFTDILFINISWILITIISSRIKLQNNIMQDNSTSIRGTLRNKHLTNQSLSLSTFSCKSFYKLATVDISPSLSTFSFQSFSKLATPDI